MRHQAPECRALGRILGVGQQARVMQLTDFSEPFRCRRHLGRHCLRILSACTASAACTTAGFASARYPARGRSGFPVALGTAQRLTPGW